MFAIVDLGCDYESRLHEMAKERFTAVTEVITDADLTHLPVTDCPTGKAIAANARGRRQFFI